MGGQGAKGRKARLVRKASVLERGRNGQFGQGRKGVGSFVDGGVPFLSPS